MGLLGSVLTADEGHHCVGNSLEEEEPVVHVDLDQHGHTGCNDVEEDDDVERADSVENHIPWTGQGLLELRHHDFLAKCDFAEVKSCNRKR